MLVLIHKECGARRWKTHRSAKSEPFPLIVSPSHALPAWKTFLTNPKCGCRKNWEFSAVQFLGKTLNRRPHMLRLDPHSDHSAWNATENGEARNQLDCKGRPELARAIQHAADDAVLDEELNSLRHFGRPGAASLHLGQIRFCHLPIAQWVSQ